MAWGVPQCTARYSWSSTRLGSRCSLSWCCQGDILTHHTKTTTVTYLSVTLRNFSHLRRTAAKVFSLRKGKLSSTRHLWVLKHFRGSWITLREKCAVCQLWYLHHYVAILIFWRKKQDVSHSTFCNNWWNLCLLTRQINITQNGNF